MGCKVRLKPGSSLSGISFRFISGSLKCRENTVRVSGLASWPEFARFQPLCLGLVAGGKLWTAFGLHQLLCGPVKKKHLALPCWAPGHGASTLRADGSQRTIPMETIRNKVC